MDSLVSGGTQGKVSLRRPKALLSTLLDKENVLLWGRVNGFGKEVSPHPHALPGVGGAPGDAVTVAHRLLLLFLPPRHRCTDCQPLGFVSCVKVVKQEMLS